MKTTVKIFALATLILGFSSSSFAQTTVSVSEPATATATILTPLSIAKVGVMSFGTVASSAIAGTVVLDYLGATSVTAGVTKFEGTTSVPTFTVTGEASKALTISFPSEVTLTGAGDGLLVSEISCDNLSTSLTSGGSLVLILKGILNVPAQTLAGTYSNTTGLKVSVNYN